MHCLMNRLAKELEVLSTFNVGKSYMYNTDAEHIWNPVWSDVRAAQNSGM